MTETEPDEHPDRKTMRNACRAAYDVIVKHDPDLTKNVIVSKDVELIRKVREAVWLSLGKAPPERPEKMTEMYGEAVAAGTLCVAIGPRARASGSESIALGEDVQATSRTLVADMRWLREVIDG